KVGTVTCFIAVLLRAVRLARSAGGKPCDDPTAQTALRRRGPASSAPPLEARPGASSGSGQASPGPGGREASTGSSSPAPSGSWAAAAWSAPPTTPSQTPPSRSTGPLGYQTPSPPGTPGKIPFSRSRAGRRTPSAG